MVMQVVKDIVVERIPGRCDHARLAFPQCMVVRLGHAGECGEDEFVHGVFAKD